MPFFRREEPIPHEPSARQRADVDLVAEARIAELDERIFKSHRNGDTWFADVLLDQRLGIRPARPADVPIIPGRPS